MPFVLSQKTSYRWPVKYDTPRDDGKYDKYEFVAEFRRLPQSRLDELGRLGKEQGVDDKDFIEEILLDWSGIKTVEGEEFAFNDINKQILLDLPGMRGAIIVAFFNSVVGAGRKN